MKRLIFFGTTSFGLPTLEGLVSNSNWEISAIVTQPDRPTGRHQALTATPVADWASQRGLSVLKFLTLKDADAVRQLQALRADLFLVAAYGLIIPSKILDIPKYHSLNIHASVLPRHRGASPIPAAIVAGDRETGITLMQMDPGIDTGPIIASAPWPIDSSITTPELERALSTLAGQVVPDWLDDWIMGKRTTIPQPVHGSSYAPKLQKADGHCTFDSAELWERKIRAYHPWPGVWAEHGDQVWKILNATESKTSIPEMPGTIVKIEDTLGLVCQEGVLVLKQIQLAGKKPQLARDILRAYPEVVGQRLT